jgi:hypothetical protein
MRAFRLVIRILLHAERGVECRGGCFDGMLAHEGERPGRALARRDIATYFQIDDPVKPVTNFAPSRAAGRAAFSVSSASR